MYSSYGLEIVGIAIDMEAKVREYSKQIQIDYPVLVAHAEGLELMRKLGNTAGGLPYTVLIDRDGHPTRRKLGALRQDELDGMVESLVQKRARPTG